jgi:anaerobic magnesium-protoporphyrin IX monomethyl ester cyclase
MNRILFIVPPHIRFEEFIHPSFNTRAVQKKQGSFGNIFTDMPLGVMALSAYLKEHHPVETRLLDFSVELNKLDSFEFTSFADFFHEILSSPLWQDYSPDLICLSALFTTSYRSVLDIAECCREVFPQALITAGGGVPTNMYKEIFRDTKAFDGLCFAEGEKPLLGLVSADDPYRYLEESLSWITATKAEKGMKNFHHDFVENLDEIPFYDYSLCDIDQYGLNPAITAYGSVDGKSRNFHVMTSRGCPSRCCFCSSHTVHGRSMRYYSVDRVREDFRRLRDDYGAKTIVFQDDHLLGDKKRACEIIEIVKKLGLTAVFQNGLALYALDRKMLEALKGAGLNQIVLAVESGSDRVLREIMHKPLDLSMVKRVADDCRELEIYTNVNILIGLPGETKQDIDDASEFLKTINANWFIILCATPLVGSEMLAICLEKDYLRGSYIDCDYKKPIVETEDFTPEYIQERAYLLNIELNFVANADMRIGDYAVALKGLENAIKAKNDHAIAYYYAAQCYEKLGNAEMAENYHHAAKAIAAKDAFWRKYFEMFNLSL